MDRRQIKNTDNTQTKHNPLPQKASNQNIAKQIYLVQLLLTTLGQETRWAYLQCSRAHTVVVYYRLVVIMTLAHVVRSTITVNN